METINGPADDVDDVDDASLTPAEFCKKENIGKTTFYQEVNSGRLGAKKVGSRTVVLPAARRRWRANLPDYVPANDGSLTQGALQVAGVVADPDGDES